MNLVGKVNIPIQPYMYEGKETPTVRVTTDNNSETKTIEAELKPIQLEITFENSQLKIQMKDEEGNNLSNEAEVNIPSVEVQPPIEFTLSENESKPLVVAYKSSSPSENIPVIQISSDDSGNIYLDLGSSDDNSGTLKAVRILCRDKDSLTIQDSQTNELYRVYNEANLHLYMHSIDFYGSNRVTGAYYWLITESAIPYKPVTFAQWLYDNYGAYNYPNYHYEARRISSSQWRINSSVQIFAEQSTPSRLWEQGGYYILFNSDGTFSMGSESIGSSCNLFDTVTQII